MACGTPLPILCGHCGFLYEPHARFCGGCARPITSLASNAPPDFHRVAEYTPPYLVNRILRSRAAIEGERKLVTVMFVDIRDSFRLIAGEDPEHAQTLLDALLRAMIDPVHRYEGTVNQVLGDGFMALFGAPIALEDHAVRAACAALAMQDVVRDAKGRLWQGLDVEALLRIGLSSGEVIIRAIGNDLSMDYRAVGPTTHMAARMEQIAQPGTIRLTGDTLQLGQGLLETDHLGRLSIKGVEEPVDVYELKGINSQQTRFAARLVRGVSPLVGRETELRQLEELLVEVVGGRSQVVLLDGEPGVGKSRLCYELVRSDGAEGCFVLETAPASYTSGTPFAALGQWLRQFFGIERSDRADAARDRVVQRVTELDRDLAGSVPAFLSVLGVPVEDEAWRALDPAQRRQRTFASAQALLDRLCLRQP